MSQIQSSAAPPAANPAPAQVRAAIARAAEATGVDFDYLLAQARLESGLDPSARAATSSAAGLYQFTSGTWLATLDRHGARHGLGWADAAIEDGRIGDPAMRAQVLGLRGDAQVSALMAAELASDNRAALTGVLGRAPDATELYLAHFLGSEGAGRFLKALAADPGQSAAAILPRAAAANRAIFHDGAAPRSVGAVMDLLRGKMVAAMVDAESSAATAPGALPATAPAWSARPGQPPASPQSPARPSMAAVLRDTFGLGGEGGGQPPAFVRAAYGRLSGLGL